MIEGSYTCGWCGQGIAGRPTVVRGRTYHAYDGDVDCARAALIVVAPRGGTG